MAEIKPFYRDFEQRNLLGRYEDDEAFKAPLSNKQATLGTTRCVLLIHSAFTILYLLVAFILLYNTSTQIPRWPIPNYIKDAVVWETQFFDVDIGHASPYTGPPTVEIDLAWHRLFEHSNLRMSAQEMSQLDHKSVMMSDENGYFANLDVHHQLHCLKFLRWYIYPEYYEFRLNHTTTQHADHCIESLRRNIMCLPSLELLRSDWVPDKPLPKPRFSYEHTCVNWDRIEAWARVRSFDVFDNTLLVNPILDPKFAAGTVEGEE